MNIKKTVLLLVGLIVSSTSFAQETRTYFAIDDLGSPVIATDESGNVVWTESYKPYGERHTSSAAALNNDRWFTGAPQNEKTGLTDLGNRQYDSRIGRFLSIDPVGVSPSDPFTFSRYDYANNNPYTYLDPDGLSVWTKLFKFAKNGGDLTLTLHGMKQDWDTLNDPSASFGDHLIAGLSLASELLPVSGRDVKEGVSAVNNLRKGADDVPNGGTFRDANGRLRNADGTFAPDGGPSRASGGTHGNTAGDQPATLYERYDADGNFQKHGVSQDPSRRYTQKELDGGYLIETQAGPRREILQIERDLVETNPGPLNREPWAGSRGN